MPTKLRKDVSIGKNLKKHRKALGMSQEEVAAQLQLLGLDTHQKTISDMELGRHSIRFSILLALADLYNVPYTAFFEDIERYEYREN